ncbi:cytochrome P450 [Catellatospora sp. TT07R-123]|uniref:cytochrome P450 n=1 Tax=Catellatospora sp. TT07R-123 TaxID=2733863 RepID=UPI001B122D8E|nr:cytochrome P450 [Catellatospora sp. TT07R-123]GHJ44350.1 cytochrome P450 [Catellatospora sp. TT07R-123]
MRVEEREREQVRGGAAGGGQVRLSRAGVGDTLRVARILLLPTVAQGLVIRRRLVTLAGRWWQPDARAVRLMQRLRGRYGGGALRLRNPGRPLVLALSTDAVRTLLSDTEPYSPATVEKTAALSRFQPHGLLITPGALRAPRRAVNERALDADLPVHHLAAAITAKISEEIAPLREQMGGRLAWDRFATAYWRAVRRIVLGDAARDDDELLDLLSMLRRDANWAQLRPRQDGVRQRFQRRLNAHLARREPGSLASLLPPPEPVVDPYGQVPHWLFAYDAAAATVLRTLAMLAVHPAQRAWAAADLRPGESPHRLPRLRACVLETLRLWPTTPAILREGTRPTRWGGGLLPARTSFLVYAPFLHRDDQTLPYAHRFEPARWIDANGHDEWSTVSFSAGPGRCPGRNLVLLTTTAILAVLLRDREPRLLSGPSLSPDLPLPVNLDHFGLRLRLVP